VAVSVSFRWLIYLGVLSMLTALLLTVLGLIRDLRAGAWAARDIQGR